MEQLNLAIGGGVADAAVLAFPTPAPVLGSGILRRVSECGMGALTSAELISLVRKPDPTVADEDSARDMLRRRGSLHGCLQEDLQLAAAMQLAARVMGENLRRGAGLESPRDSAAFLKAQLAHRPYEVFAVLFLDNRRRVLAYEEMFRGTLDGASVHSREVVRACLKHNAAAIICAHNHPSGVAEPSEADRNITKRLRDAVDLIGVRLLDHVVVGADEPTSMAARGLI